MNTSADAADQVVRMSLNGAEVALKVSGKGAKEIGILLIKALKSSSHQQLKTKGSLRLNNLIRSGKKLDVAEVSDGNLKEFCSVAKKYGILYTILKDRNVNDGKTEIMYKSEDKEKIGRIFKKLGLLAVDFGTIKEEVQQEMSGQPAPDRPEHSEKEVDEFVDKLMEKANPTKEAGQNENPTQARTEKPNLSASSSRTEVKMNLQSSSENPERRKSVRKELKEIREEQNRTREAERKRTPRTPTKTNEHKAPPKKKRDKER